MAWRLRWLESKIIAPETTQMGRDKSSLWAAHSAAILHTSRRDAGGGGGGGGGREKGRGSHLRPWHHRLITYHVSPAAPRQAQRDRFHLSSLRGSQYNLLCWSDIQRRGVELPNLILQMRTLLFLPSHVLVCCSKRRGGVGISDLALIWKHHLGLSGSCGFISLYTRCMSKSTHCSFVPERCGIHLAFGNKPKKLIFLSNKIVNYIDAQTGRKTRENRRVSYVRLLLWCQYNGITLQASMQKNKEIIILKSQKQKT